MPNGMKMIRVILPDTGEEVDAIAIDHLNKRAKREITEYVSLFTAGMRRAWESNLTVTDYNVLMVVLSRAEINRAFPTEPAAIAAELKIDTRRVYNSLARLEGLGLIGRPKRGWLALNPEYAWKGSHKERLAALGQEEA